MKINFVTNPSDALNGHMNIDITAEGFGPYLNRHGTGLCDEAEATMIIATDILQYFSSLETDNIISHWISRLRHKGTLIISGPDLLSLAKAIVQRDISLMDANIFIYGDQREPWDFYKSMFTASELAEALRGAGLKINKYIVGDYRYTIEAERP